MPETLDAAARSAVFDALNLALPELDPRAYKLTALPNPSRISVVVRAEELSGENDIVLRLIAKGDLAPGAELPAPRVEGAFIASQRCDQVGAFSVIQREFVPHVFTAGELIQETQRFGNNREHLGEFVRQFLGQALSACESLHNAGLVHGDIRPEKFGFTHSGELVLRDVGVRLRGEFKDVEYVAPELLSARRPRYTNSTDIYALLRVARSLLRPFQGDLALPDLSTLDARVGWLQDYFHPRRDRPSAELLRRFLLEGRYEHAKIDDFLDAYNDAKNAKRRGPAQGSPRIRELGHLLTAYPETHFAIDGSPGGRRLARWFALADEIETSSSRGIFRPGRHPYPKTKESGRDFDTHKMSKRVDDVWMNRIHRMLFGFPIDAAHEERMAKLPDHHAPDREAFARAIEGANDARLVLLSENDMLSTREALEVVGRAIHNGIDREEFMVLRRWGFVLAVHDHGRCLYPAFQFRNGVVSSRIQQVHRKFRTARGESDPNPWTELTFWSVRREVLGGKALKDVLWQESMRSQVNRVVQDACI